MPGIIIPIFRTVIEEPVTHRFPLFLSVDIGSRLAPVPMLLAADITSGEGTVVFVDAISETLDSAR